VDEDETTESDALSQIVGELLTQFPAIPPEVVADHVHRAHEGMESAPVQDYMLVLVQRQARLSLATTASTDTPPRTDADDGRNSA
jgi:hypothetical protein